jgi:hypothetical protein
VGQILRPDSNVTTTNVTGSYTDIDESSANDADYAFSTNNTAATFTVGLSNPTATPGAGTTTIRYRLCETNGGLPSGEGGNVSLTLSLLEGSTVRDTKAAEECPGAFAGFTWTPDTSAVSNWNNLRLRFVFSKSGAGTPRGGAVSWAEFEAPSASYTLTANSGTFALTGTAASLRVPRTLTATGGSFSLTGATAGLNFGRFIGASAGAFSLTGANVTLTATGAFGLVADPAVFVLTGANAGLFFGSKIAAAEGTFALTGSDAGLLSGFTLHSEAGAFDMAGGGAVFEIIERSYFFGARASRQASSSSRRTSFGSR